MVGGGRLVGSSRDGRTMERFDGGRQVSSQGVGVELSKKKESGLQAQALCVRLCAAACGGCHACSARA